MRVVVAYDISHDGTRARAAAVLASWGDRIQRSVFECQLDNDELEEVLYRLGALIDPERDVIQAFRQCAGCCAERSEIGQAVSVQQDPYWIV